MQPSTAGNETAVLGSADSRKRAVGWIRRHAPGWIKAAIYAGLAYFAADHIAGFTPPGPVLLLVGEMDEVAPPANSRAIAATWPQAKLAEIKGAGHLLQIEKPDLFNQAVVDFLKE